MRSNMEEARLARAAAAGDGQAFARLYDRYEKPIYNYCLRLLGNEHDAQDATQDAFLKIMRRLPELGDRQVEFGPYLYTIARNASYDMIGRRKRAEPVEKIAEETGRPLGDGPPLDEDPVRAALLAAEQDSIRAANARLPERQREVLALREIEGMSYEDIADLLEMNSNSVAQLISRARIRLRDELRGEAAASITAGSVDCERALPLLARRQDGKLDQGDGEWLELHLTGCTTCPLAAEAMAEAGASYRAWAPVIPAAWLFRDTVAKAADLAGADWSGVQRPRASGEVDADGTAGESSPGDDPPSPDERKRGHRRRGLFAASSAALLLLMGGLAATVFSGVADDPPVTEKTSAAKQPPTTTSGEAPEADPPESTTKTPSEAQKPKKKKKAPAKAAPVVTAPSPAPVTAPSAPAQPAASAPVTDPPEPDRPTKPARERGVDGTGTWGERTETNRPRPADKPARPAPTPPVVTPTPPAPPQPTPPAPTEPPPTTDPRGPNDPPVGGGQQPPIPCVTRVC